MLTWSIGSDEAAAAVSWTLLPTTAFAVGTVYPPLMAWALTHRAPFVVTASFTQPPVFACVLGATWLEQGRLEQVLNRTSSPSAIRSPRMLPSMCPPPPSASPPCSVCPGQSCVPPEEKRAVLKHSNTSQTCRSCLFTKTS